MYVCVCVCASIQDGEALEAGTKKFEDLEFQQLERESSLEEERETISQQLLQERAEYHSSVAKRKVRGRPHSSGFTRHEYASMEATVKQGSASCRALSGGTDQVTLEADCGSCGVLQDKVSALESQASQLGLQASQECERLAKDRTHTLQMLQKVGVSTSHTATGGRG